MDLGFPWNLLSLFLSWPLHLLEVYLLRAMFILETKTWVTGPGRVTCLYTCRWLEFLVLTYGGRSRMGIREQRLLAVKRGAAVG